ncbi:MAG TPA: MoxR family ATPase, partial [Dehalococcoidia bacterium]|nr:MoxR family ATPase [Dehalococcoidia bacterium]
MEDPKIIAERILDNVQKVIIGKEAEVRLTVVCLLCAGHLLIEDVPGVGKTMLARSLAKSTGCEFKRIQFTPDILPSDVTGVSVYNQKSGDFEFRPGPIVAEIVLADEINRATPKTQSSLLEAMEEHRVTVDGVTRDLPRPFMVLATQNPIEYEGTFPLPEAQLDRFFMRISLGYPTRDEEVAIMDRRESADPIDQITAACAPSDILELQVKADEVYINDLVKQYIVDLANASRDHRDSALGVSPRASLNLMKGSKAKAMIHGRDYVNPDDVKGIATAVMAHRVLLSPSARMRGVTQEAIIDEILNAVPVPGGGGGRAAS